MVHWVDRLSKAVARTSLVRESRSALPPESSAVVISEEETSIQKGPCQIVQRGEQIGTVGTAGGKYLAHLHFEVLAQGLHQDPGSFLAKAKPQLTVAQAVAPLAKRRR